MKKTWFTLAMVALVLFSTNTPARATQARRPQVDVVRGGKVEITLNDHSRNLNPLIFRIIGQPRYGKLSQLMQHQGNGSQGSGFVTYTHGNDPDSTTDTFAFEVTDSSTGRRGRGRMIIRILDAPSVSASSLPPTNKKTTTASTITKALITFGDISLGAAEEEFLQANPLAKLVNEAPNPDEVVRTYSLLPPDSTDSDLMKFVFRDGKLTQIDHEFDAPRLDKKGAAAWHEGLSRLFGNEGEAYQPDAGGPRLKSARKWLSSATGEAANLEIRSDGSARVSFYESDQ